MGLSSYTDARCSQLPDTIWYNSRPGPNLVGYRRNKEHMRLPVIPAAPLTLRVIITSSCTTMSVSLPATVISNYPHPRTPPPLLLLPSALSCGCNPGPSFVWALQHYYQGLHAFMLSLTQLFSQTHLYTQCTRVIVINSTNNSRYRPTLAHCTEVCQDSNNGAHPGP